MPFSDKVLNIVAGYEAYSLLDGYSRYHQISLTPNDRYKTIFVTNWGAFVWMVMPFGVKNGPPTFQRLINRTFKEYLDQFMKIFLEDFTVYSDMESHLMKLKFCFQKCKKYKISLNPKKCAFLVFLGLILRFIVCKERKIPNLKKVQTIMNMLILTNFSRFRFLMVWLSFIDVSSRTLPLSWHQSPS